MSESKNKIKPCFYSKISRVQNEIGAIVKTETNPHFKSSYFDINALVNKLMPLLKKQNLVLLQPIQDGKVVSIIIDVDTKEELRSEMTLPQIDVPQKMGSCITYFRRYTLQSLLALEAEDDDGNKASQERTRLWLNPKTKEWDEAVKYLASVEGASIQAIKVKYNISSKNETNLKDQVANVFTNGKN